MRRSGWVSADRVLLLAVAAAVAVALLVGNPYSDRWPLKCPLFQLTGWQCPLCGMQRQLHALSRLQWQEAWRLNAGLLLGYPYLGLLLLGQICAPFRRSRWGQWCYRDAVVLTWVGAMLLWGIFRNLNVEI